MRSLARLPLICGLAALAVLLAGCSQRVDPADLVLRGGRIVTLEEATPRATALAAREGRIVAVGTDREVEAFVGPRTEVLDLEGRLAVPGFIEGHGHLLSLGRAKLSPDLTGAQTWEEVVETVADAASKTPPGQWVVGRGWHQEKWAAKPTREVGGFPVHDALSAACPEHPVLLTHASGHAAIANAVAMKRAGITGSTPDPAGGRLLRDRRGRLTGVLIETAVDLVSDVRSEDLARRSTEEIREERVGQIVAAVEECLGKGITSFHDAGADFETVDLFRRLADDGRLGVRLYVMLRGTNEELSSRLAACRTVDDGDDHLTVRAIKKSIDGALGTRSAWLLEPYADEPGSTGHDTATVEEIRETARLAIEHGYQLCVHAIGDRANRETLDLYENVFREHPEATGLRWRIEHAQHLHPDDIPRFGRLGVIAAMQAVHCTSDAPWVVARLGASRAGEGAYVWRELLDSGAVIVNGTDAPVEDVDPIRSFHAAVTRRLPDGSAFFPEQRMTRDEALRSYTSRAAYAAFEEELKGSLQPGKLADIVVLSKDILTVPETEILETRVVYTIVGGRVLYRR